MGPTVLSGQLPMEIRAAECAGPVQKDAWLAFPSDWDKHVGDPAPSGLQLHVGWFGEPSIDCAGDVMRYVLVENAGDEEATYARAKFVVEDHSSRRVERECSDPQEISPGCSENATASIRLEDECGRADDSAAEVSARGRRERIDLGERDLEIKAPCLPTDGEVPLMTESPNQNERRAPRWPTETVSVEGRTLLASVGHHAGGKEAMGRPSVEELESVFDVLSNRTRLQILIQIQEPRSAREIKVTPSRDDEFSDDRYISTEAVKQHLRKLGKLGLVHKEREGRRNIYSLNHSRLFAALETARQLSLVRGQVDQEGPTITLAQDIQSSKSEEPHFVISRGVQEGKALTLEWYGVKDAWTIGRDPECDIALDYDAFVSSEHAEVRHEEGRFVLEDNPENTNGTFLNWEQLDEGETVGIEAGDVVGVGMTLLVFREGSR